MLALSTRWVHKKTISSLDFKNLKEIGFDTVEIDWYFSEDQFYTLRNSLEREKIKVISVHNPVLMTDGKSFDIDFGNRNKEIREESIRITKETIDIASQLNAKFVIIHLGDIDFSGFDDDKGDIFRLYRKFGRISDEYVKFRDKFSVYRKKHSEIHLDYTFEAIEILINHSSKKNVKLGIESRVSAFEIPSLEELCEIFKKFGNEWIGFWNDTGHTTIQERMGFYRKGEHLERLQKYLFGFHIHDVDNSLHDHLPPGKGTVDFYSFTKFINRDTPLVIEVPDSVKKEDIISSKILLENIFI